MLATLARLRARLRLTREVGLWYHSEYAPDLGPDGRIPGIVPYRGELILGQLVTERLIRAGDVRAPHPVSLHTLARVHPPAYLESVTRAETLGRIFGLDPAVVAVDPLLTAARRAVGGTIGAALACGHGLLETAVNLGGGFHHAEPDRGGGFCIYNDVAAAIAVLRHKGFADRIAIVDLDYHQGNGNLVFFANDPTVLTYSLHASVWTEVDAVADVGVLVPTGSGDAAYLAQLRETLPKALAAHKPALVFFLAGNDVLAGDRLGDLKLTPAGVLERDRLTLKWIREVGARTVVTLAGGYSRPAWECSVNLVRYALSGEARAARKAPRFDLRHLYRRVARALDPFELQKEQPGELELTAEDLLLDLGAHPPARRFLGYYTVQGIEYALERYGILDRLRDLGFRDLRVTGELEDRWRQVVRIHGRKRRDPAHTYHLLAEVVARRTELPAPGPLEPPGPLEVLWVEWLMLQDPTAEFSPARPRLPGQSHPGLGLSGEILEALVQICYRLGLDGILHRPAHYHNALVGARHFHFLDPEAAGRFEAIRRVVSGRPLPEATQLVEDGRLALGDGTRLPWEPADYAFPVSPRLKAWLAAPGYQTRAGQAERALLDAGLHLEGAAAVSAPSRSGAGARTPPPRS